MHSIILAKLTPFFIGNRKIQTKKDAKLRPLNYIMVSNNYSTVTDFAKFLGWSTLHPLITAI